MEGHNFYDQQTRTRRWWWHGRISYFLFYPAILLCKWCFYGFRPANVPHPDPLIGHNLLTFLFNVIVLSSAAIWIWCRTIGKGKCPQRFGLRCPRYARRWSGKPIRMRYFLVTSSVPKAGKFWLLQVFSKTLSLSFLKQMLHLQNFLYGILLSVKFTPLDETTIIISIRV